MKKIIFFCTLLTAFALNKTAFAQPAMNPFDALTQEERTILENAKANFKPTPEIEALQARLAEQQAEALALHERTQETLKKLQAANQAALSAVNPKMPEIIAKFDDAAKKSYEAARQSKPVEISIIRDFPGIRVLADDECAKFLDALSAVENSPKYQIAKQELAKVRVAELRNSSQEIAGILDKMQESQKK